MMLCYAIPQDVRHDVLHATVYVTSEGGLWVVRTREHFPDGPEQGWEGDEEQFHDRFQAVRRAFQVCEAYVGDGVGASVVIDRTGRG